MKFAYFIVFLGLVGGVQSESAYHQRFYVLSAINERSHVDYQAKFDEITSFANEKCLKPRRASISIQRASDWADDGFMKLTFIKYGVMRNAGFEDGQVYYVPDVSSEVFLRRNNLWDLILKLKNPVIIEIFC